MKPLIHHAHSRGPNPFKVAIVLENLKLPYEARLWDLGDGENGVKGPHLTKLNENGRVPVLEDPNTGVIAWESMAVINHLLRTYDKTYTLHPGPSSPAQDLVDYDKWTSFLITTLGPMMGQLNWFTHYHHSKNEDARERYYEQAMRCFEVLDGQLKKSGGKSILPSGFSAVDCHGYCWCLQWDYAGLDLGRFEFVRKWMECIGERGEVKKVYEEIPKAPRGVDMLGK
ncbi:MAG: hypothetical protein Q9201_007015 [Fulgogasparrea decipioides]